MKVRCAEQQKSDNTSNTTEKYRKWQGFHLDGQNERFWNSDKGHHPTPPPPLSPQEDNVDIFVQVQGGLKFNTYLTIQLSEMGNLAVFGRKKN